MMKNKSEGYLTQAANFMLLQVTVEILWGQERAKITDKC